METPRHTVGIMSFFDTLLDGVTYQVGIFGGA